MRSSLSPARRRFFVGVLVIALLGGAAVVVASLVRGEDGVRPTAQDKPGPVLLVPGYGGSTSALRVLADALAASGRETHLVRTVSATGDLRDQAADLDTAVRRVLADSGASSVDLIGYSAGGVVLRYSVAERGRGSTVRRAVTLASPHHGTDLAALAGALGSQACPEACRQLAPDSDFLHGLNAADETPPGPAWVAVWTENDKTVVPPDSGSLDGAVDVPVQSVCPGLVVDHADVPRTPAVIAIVESVLGLSPPTEPGPEVC